MAIHVRFEASIEAGSPSALVVFVGAGSHLSAGAQALESAGGGQLGRAMKAANFDGKKGKLVEILNRRGEAWIRTKTSHPSTPCR